MTVGTMEVTLVGAKGLKKTDLFDKMDPYVVIQFRNEQHTTRIAQGQGSTPVWNEEFKFNVEYPSLAVRDADHQSYKLLLQIMDHDTFTSDDYVGQTTIYLKELFALGVELGRAELGTQKHRVILKDRTYYGEIQVGITFTVKGGE